MSTRLDLPPFTLADLRTVDRLLAEAESGLEHSLAQLRTLLQQRDLLEQWSDDDGAFCAEFSPVAAKYHRLQRALLELTGEEFGWSHDLSTWVDAQR